MEGSKFMFDMTPIPQLGSCWKDREEVEFIFTQVFGSLSLCVAILTKLIQRITHCNQLCVSRG